MDKKENMKLDNEGIAKKLKQVISMSINLPIEDKATRLLYHSLMDNLHVVPFEEDDCTYVDDIPINDFINVLLGCLEYCDKKYDVMILTSIMSIMETFVNLKFLSLCFKKDSSLMESYKIMLDEKYTEDKTDIFKSIYNIDIFEMNLSSMFSQNIIDSFNKMLIFYGYMSNNYFERTFVINFEFDDYTSFIEMLIRNNRDFNVNNIDFNDFYVNLAMFPTCVADNKPVISIVTNYSIL